MTLLTQVANHASMAASWYWHGIVRGPLPIKVAALAVLTCLAIDAVCAVIIVALAVYSWFTSLVHVVS